MAVSVRQLQPGADLRPLLALADKALARSPHAWFLRLGSRWPFGDLIGLLAAPVFFSVGWI